MKVVHNLASSNAVGLLQRDFGIQLSNVFDIASTASQIKKGGEPEALWKSYCGEKDIPLEAEQEASQALALGVVPLANENVLAKKASYSSFSLLPLAKVISDSLGEVELSKSHQEFNAKHVLGAKYTLNAEKFDENTSY